MSAITANEHTIKNVEFLGNDYRDKNKKYNEVEVKNNFLIKITQAKLIEIGEEIAKNEELLKFENYQNNKLTEINKDLTRKLSFKDNEVFDYNKKIEELKSDVDRFSGNQIGLDKERLNKNLENQVCIARDLTKNNVKVFNIMY